MQSTEKISPTHSGSCPVCHGHAAFLDRVNFNKSCEEVRGQYFPPSEKFIDYFLCEQCGFCFAPEMYAWTFDDFGRFIYNQDYVLVDPDYKQNRPVANAQLIDQTFGTSKSVLRHLDYGGGSGVLSRVLCDKGWDSSTYDPFVHADVRVSDLGSYDLVTAFEVFEHVTDIDGLLRNLHILCKPDGLVLFSTLLSDGEIAQGNKLTWWYAGPRNGHISLFSAKSLQLCLQRGGFQMASFSPNLHMAFRQIPTWASHLLQPSAGQSKPQPQPHAMSDKLREAITLHMDGHSAQAQAAYEAILAEQPDQHDALHYMGVLAMQGGDFERALVFLDRAIALCADNFGFYINHGNTLKKLMRLDAALASFDRAIALNPTVADIHVMRGSVLQELQELDSAISSFEKAIAINPDFVEAHEARQKAWTEREKKACAKDFWLTNPPADYNVVKSDLQQFEGDLSAHIVD